MTSIYPAVRYPQFREPIFRRLSEAQLEQAACEFENRRLETEYLYLEADRRGNIVRRRFLAMSAKLLERQRVEFFRAQAEQGKLVAITKGKRAVTTQSRRIAA